MRKPRRKDATRILLVEDHASTLHILSAALRLHGHRVTAVATMREALDSIHETIQDLLVCDIGLPDGDGWQLLETIRTRSAIPAIAMSAYGGPSDLNRSSAAGFAIHLIKPFDPDELYEAIARLAPPLAPATPRRSARAKVKASR